MNDFASAALPWILLGIGVALAATQPAGRSFENSRMTPGAVLGFALGLLLSACGLVPLHLGMAGGLLLGLLAGKHFPKNDEAQARTDRITRMEALFDRVQADLAAGVSPDPEDLRELTDYYESPLWREDFEADEQGLLPQGLKRGVLSEDGLYNLLDRLRETNP